MDRFQRRDRIEELHSAGLTCPEIARKVGVSRVTAWRVVKRMGLTPVAPKRTSVEAPGRPADGPIPDAGVLRREALELLRAAAQEGSTTAAKELLRASDKALDRRGRCSGHVGEEEVKRALTDTFETVQKRVLNVANDVLFVDVEEGMRSALEDALDRAAEELTVRSAAGTL